jgi:hypothetical protein
LRDKTERRRREKHVPTKLRILIDAAKAAAETIDKHGMHDTAHALKEAVKLAEPDPTPILHELGAKVKVEGPYTLVEYDGKTTRFLSADALNDWAHSQRFKKLGKRTFQPAAVKPAPKVAAPAQPAAQAQPQHHA